MHFLFKFVIVLTAVAGILTLVAYIGSQIPTDETRPESLPTYQQAVPQGFQATNIQRVLDPRDAGRIMNPTPSITQIADTITQACTKRNEECMVRALTTWTRINIEHTEVLQVRDHILTPEETILFRQADDLAMSVLLVSMMRSQNLDARIGRTPYSTFVEVTIEEELTRIDLGCVNCALGNTRFRGEDNRVTWIN